MKRELSLSIFEARRFRTPRSIILQVLSKSAAIRNEYEDGWPILSYLKIALKSHKSTRENDSGGSGGPAIKRKHNPMRDVRDTKAFFSSLPYSTCSDSALECSQLSILQDLGQLQQYLVSVAQGSTSDSALFRRC